MTTITTTMRRIGFKGGLIALLAFALLAAGAIARIPSPSKGEVPRKARDGGERPE